jgi:hypothetical protein
VPVEKVPPRALDEVRRLVTALTSLPELAGRLALDDPPPAPPNYSGALLVTGTWTDRDGQQPAIAKIGASVAEVRWATLLARETSDLVPEVYASGAALAGEQLPWLVMERAPLLLDHG